MSTPGTGRTIAFDDVAEGGLGPVETVLAALAACTAMDVISIALKKRQPVVDLPDPRPRRASATSTRRSTPGSTSSTRSSGPGVSTAAIARCIELSATKYCPVSAMLSAGATEIHHAYRVSRPGEPTEEAEVIVTGPYQRPESSSTRVPRGQRAFGAEGGALLMLEFGRSGEARFLMPMDGIISCSGSAPERATGSGRPRGRASRSGSRDPAPTSAGSRAGSRGSSRSWPAASGGPATASVRPQPSVVAPSANETSARVSATLPSTCAKRGGYSCSGSTLGSARVLAIRRQITP